MQLVEPKRKVAVLLQQVMVTVATAWHKLNLVKGLMPTPIPILPAVVEEAGMVVAVPCETLARVEEVPDISALVSSTERLAERTEYVRATAMPQ